MAALVASEIAQIGGGGQGKSRLSVIRLTEPGAPKRTSDDHVCMQIFCDPTSQPIGADVTNIDVISDGNLVRGC